MVRNNEENYLAFVERSTEALANGEINFNEWSQDLIDEVPYSDETLRRIAIFVEKFLAKLESEELKGLERDRVSELRKAKAELERERIKFRQEKNEANEERRHEARNDLYHERIVEAIEKLEPIRIPNATLDCLTFPVKQTALLLASDFHAGSNFEVKGIYGEVVNAYNFDIMEARMWSFLRQFLEEDRIYDNIVVGFLGDFLENVLRISSLQKLREPVVDTTIRLGEFLANWLCKLLAEVKVPITVISVGGNHDVQRLLNSKPQFEDENLGKLVVEFIKLRLQNVTGIEVKDYQEIAIENIRGTTIAFAHGEDKDLETTINYFSNLYNYDIDEIYCGHFHRPESKSIGITEIGDRIINRIGSICGTDTYAKKCRVSARPSAHVAFYTDEGKTWSRNYYL